MTRRDFKEQMGRLREIIDQRVAEYDARHRRRFQLKRLAGLRRSQDPHLSTVLQGAHDLETTVGDLLEEPAVGEADHQKLVDFVEFLIERFDLTGTRAAAARETGSLSVTEAEFIERDFDYPRAHHVWIVPHAKAAAGSGIEADRDTETTEVLHSIRDVYNGQLRVIQVKGESMSPVLRDGDKVTFDIRRMTPKEGDVVVVYDSVRGGIVGYWRRGENGECWLDKENAAPERFDAAGGWTLWGTVTRIVDTPVHPRHPRRG